MKIPISTERHIAVIGGGIAGLAAAWYLQQQGIQYTLFEKSQRFGGLIHTQYQGDLVIEMGPDAFITRKPWALELALALGLQGEILAANHTAERIYVLSNGRLIPLPDGLHLLVPTKMGPFLQSPLLSWTGKMRLLMDYVIPPSEVDEDESLADFVTRRMGVEALDKLADPLLAGVYNAEMEHQSILATFPQYRQLEKQHGSLIRGMIEAQVNAPPPDKPPLVSFQRGMMELIDRLVEKLTGQLQRNTTIESIQRIGNDYRLLLNDNTTLDADGIILATPAHVTAGLLRRAVPQAAERLRAIRYVGVGSASFAFLAEDIPRQLDAYGVVIPGSAGRHIDGMQWSSAKWLYRAPEDMALLRVFFGGPHTREMLDKPEYELVPILREELRALLGITNKPVYQTIGKWVDAYPQYDVGHLGRVQKIEAALPDNVALAGNAYHGVGIPDTIKTAKAAAQQFIESKQND